MSLKLNPLNLQALAVVLEIAAPQLRLQRYLSVPPLTIWSAVWQLINDP